MAKTRGVTKILVAVSIATLLAWALTPAAVQAVVITFETADLADAIPGQDLWRYTYVVSEFSPVQNIAFETLFDPLLYQALEDPPPAVTGWDILSLQPDPNLPDAGRYSVLALVDGAALTEPFQLTFVWLGGAGTAPGSQPFELNQFDAQGGFITTLEMGVTTPGGPAPGPQPVTAPRTLLLVAAGMLAAGLLTERAGRRQRSSSDSRTA